MSWGHTKLLPQHVPTLMSSKVESDGDMQNLVLARRAFVSLPDAENLTDSTLWLFIPHAHGMTEELHLPSKCHPQFVSLQEGEDPGLLQVYYNNVPISRLTARPRGILQKSVHFIPGNKS